MSPCDSAANARLKLDVYLEGFRHVRVPYPEASRPAAPKLGLKLPLLLPRTGEPAAEEGTLGLARREEGALIRPDELLMYPPPPPLRSPSQLPPDASHAVLRTLEAVTGWLMKL